jgi:hypothetical protein
VEPVVSGRLGSVLPLEPPDPSPLESGVTDPESVAGALAVDVELDALFRSYR